jgi:hypothetical protein
MAGDSRIVATIWSLGGSTGMPDTNAEFIIQYRCTGPVTGQTNGEVVLQANVTQNETQIKSDLSTALAAYLNTVIFPSQSYAANDVRGLNI